MNVLGAMLLAACLGFAACDDESTTACSAGETKCVGESSLATCGDDGQWGDAVTCPSDQICHDMTGAAADHCMPAGAMGGDDMDHSRDATSHSGDSMDHAIDDGMHHSMDDGM